MVLARLAVDDYRRRAATPIGGRLADCVRPASVTGGVRAIVMGDKSDTPSTLR